MSGQRKPWHTGTYHVDARRCREAAYANPEHRCRRCGLTLLEGIAAYGTRGAAWEAGHPLPLTAEHAHCNRSAGAIAGNRARERRSRRWFA